MSTFTPNKNFEQPANNADIDTWDVPVNANSGAIDTAFGGHVTINVVAASGTVTLVLAQYLPPIIILSGLLSADVNYQFPSGVGGFWMVSNGTTGAHSITFSSAGAGTSVVIPQGYSGLINCDATNVRFGNTMANGAAGSNGNVQYNTSGILAGSSSFTFDGTKLTTQTFRVASQTAGIVVSDSSGNNTSLFLAHSSGTNGYDTSPNGTVTQWGISGTIGAGAATDVTVATPFANNFFNVVITPRFNGTTVSQNYVGIKNLSQFTLVNGTDTAGTFFWQAIGN